MPKRKSLREKKTAKIVGLVKTRNQANKVRIVVRQKLNEPLTAKSVNRFCERLIKKYNFRQHKTRQKMPEKMVRESAHLLLWNFMNKLKIGKSRAMLTQKEKKQIIKMIFGLEEKRLPTVVKLTKDRDLTKKQISFLNELKIENPRKLLRKMERVKKLVDYETPDLRKGLVEYLKKIKNQENVFEKDHIIRHGSYYAFELATDLMTNLRKYSDQTGK